MDQSAGRLNLFSRVATSGVTVALSGLVAWATSVYFERTRISLEANQTKIQIINLVKDEDTALALALIDYYQSIYGNDDKSYSTFLRAMSSYIASAPQAITKQPKSPTAHSAVNLTVEAIRDQFYSSNRRQFAEHIVDLYNASNAPERQSIVTTLLNGIISDQSDNREYRINLYIALTFSLLPNTSMSPKEFKDLESLKEFGDYRAADGTFRLNVDNAIAKQRPS